jgi:hypothetical protein
MGFGDERRRQCTGERGKRDAALTCDFDLYPHASCATSNHPLCVPVAVVVVEPYTLEICARDAQREAGQRHSQARRDKSTDHDHYSTSALPDRAVTVGGPISSIGAQLTPISAPVRTQKMS